MIRGSWYKNSRINSIKLTSVSHYEYLQQLKTYTQMLGDQIRIE